jgi:hypothetical protein
MGKVNTREVIDRDRRRFFAAAALTFTAAACSRLNCVAFKSLRGSGANHQE